MGSLPPEHQGPFVTWPPTHPPATPAVYHQLPSFLLAPPSAHTLSPASHPANSYLIFKVQLKPPPPGSFSSQFWSLWPSAFSRENSLTCSQVWSHRITAFTAWKAGLRCPGGAWKAGLRSPGGADPLVLMEFALTATAGAGLQGHRPATWSWMTPRLPQLPEVHLR